jgi:hypothetical protein
MPSEPVWLLLQQFLQTLRHVTFFLAYVRLFLSFLRLATVGVEGEGYGTAAMYAVRLITWICTCSLSHTWFPAYLKWLKQSFILCPFPLPERTLGNISADCHYMC